MIRAEGLLKTYGRRFPTTVVQETTFALDEGSSLGILGPRGSGKSTLLRMLAATLRPSAGRATLGGFDTVRETAKARDILGYVPDFFDFRFWDTSRAFLRFGGWLSGLSGRRLASRLEALLELLEMPDLLDERLLGYPMGVQKRLLLLQALLPEPRVLILDEPLAPLMGEEWHLMVRVLQELRRRRMTLLLSSPHRRDVQATSDRVAVMYEGRLSRVFESQELLRRVGEKRHARIFVQAESLPSAATEALRKLSGVIDVRATASTTVVYIMPGKVTTTQVEEVLKGEGVSFRSVREAEVTLGDVFRAIQEDTG